MIFIGFYIFIGILVGDICVRQYVKENLMPGDPSPYKIFWSSIIVWPIAIVVLVIWRVLIRINAL